MEEAKEWRLHIENGGLPELMDAPNLRSLVHITFLNQDLRPFKDFLFHLPRLVSLDVSFDRTNFQLPVSFFNVPIAY